MGIDPCADSRAAQGDLRQFALSMAHACDAALNLACVTKKFLAQPDRRGILQVGAAGLDDRHELVGLLLQRLLQTLQHRYQVMLDADQRREVDSCRDHVVR